MNCTAKHSICQPEDDEFKCPKCEADVEHGFLIDLGAEGSYKDDWCCEILHDLDELRCECGYSLWGKELSESLMKKKNLKPCPTCKGEGTVKDEKI